jgi:hypothetical protein
LRQIKRELFSASLGAIGSLTETHHPAPDVGSGVGVPKRAAGTNVGKRGVLQVQMRNLDLTLSGASKSFVNFRGRPIV